MHQLPSVVAKSIIHHGIWGLFFSFPVLLLQTLNLAPWDYFSNKLPAYKTDLGETWDKMIPQWPCLCYSTYLAELYLYLRWPRYLSGSYHILRELCFPGRSSLSRDGYGTQNGPSRVLLQIFSIWSYWKK